MNALVAIRSNGTGFLSPTPEQRESVARTLDETAAARAGTATSSAAAAGAVQAGSSASGTNNVREGVGDELGKQAFLELLILELQNQNPLEPISNTEMLAQLAQFSSLEAQTNLNENVLLMSENIDQLNFISAAQLLGKTVTGVDLNGELRSGLVEAVHLDGSLVVLTVDGEFMTMAGIVGIKTTPESGVDTGTGDTGDGGTGNEPAPNNPSL